MYTVVTSSFWQFLQSFFSLVGGALRLDPEAFRAVQTHVNADFITLTILILAGISVALGQSVVLLANRVTPRRFVISLLLNGVLFVGGLVIWSAIFAMVGRFIYGVTIPFSQFSRVVSLAYAPLLFGFFILLPYMGSFLDHLLDIWTFLLMIVAISVSLHLDFWQALSAALLGLITIQVLKYTIGRPVVALERWLRKEAAGTAVSNSMRDLVANLPEKLRDQSEEDMR